MQGWAGPKAGGEHFEPTPAASQSARQQEAEWEVEQAVLKHSLAWDAGAQEAEQHVHPRPSFSCENDRLNFLGERTNVHTALAWEQIRGKQVGGGNEERG